MNSSININYNKIKRAQLLTLSKKNSHSVEQNCEWLREVLKPPNNHRHALTYDMAVFLYRIQIG